MTYSKEIEGTHGIAKLFSNHGICYLHLPKELYPNRKARKKVSLSPLRYDCAHDRKKAENILLQVNEDLYTGNFDHTCKKYKPKLQVVVEAKDELDRDLLAIYERYKNDHWDKVRPGTRRAYNATYRHVQKCPDYVLKGLEKPLLFIDYLKSQDFGNETIFRDVQQVGAAVAYGQEIGSNKIASNVWRRTAGRLKKENKPKNKKSKPRALTSDQMNTIIEAFKSNRYYSHYWYFVAFSFYTGCRPSEVIPLEWRDISPDFTKIKINRVYVYGDDHKYHLEQGLKQQQARIIPLTKKAQNILKLAWENKQHHKLIFPSPKGIYIHQLNFCRRGWKKVLESVNIPSDIWEGFTHYKTRATFITDKKRKNIAGDNIAKYVGNSPNVIYNYYDATTSEDINIDDW